MTTFKKGIDISHYDPIIDWDKLAESGVDFVYIKCTQGIGFIDPLCATHAKNATSKNIAIGYYHFADTTMDAAIEANLFKSQISKLPSSGLLPVLDIETNKSNLTPGEIEIWIQKFLDTFADALMIYSYQPFLDQNLPYGHLFGTLPLWLAQYRNIATPFLPKGWLKCDLWQNTNQLKVDGVQVPVDGNIPLTDNFIND